MLEAAVFAPKSTGFGDIEVVVAKEPVRHPVDVLWFRHGCTSGNRPWPSGRILGMGKAVVMGETPFGRNITGQAPRRDVLAP